MVSRRTFLLTGAAALAGAILVGAEYLHTPTFTGLKRTSSTQQTEFSSTRLYSLNGRLFSDINGNGIQDGGETVVPHVGLDLIDKIATNKDPNLTPVIVAKAVTDSSGDYKFDIPAGQYKLVLHGSPHQYACISLEEFRNVKDGYDLTLLDDRRFDIGLMDGFLTSPLPIKAGIPNVLYYVDLDPRPGKIRDWKCGDLTYDGHGGTDFLLPVGTRVFAAAPGVVVDSAYTPDSGNIIWMNHPNNTATFYGHLNSRSVTISQNVKRGDLLGFSGYTGKNHGPAPHLHFEINILANPGGPMDPYRDLCYSSLLPGSYASSTSSWTLDNDPIPIG